MMVTSESPITSSKVVIKKPVIILVDPYEYKKGDPLINDKPTFEISKPEKKPDDKTSQRYQVR